MKIRSGASLTQHTIGWLSVICLLLGTAHLYSQFSLDFSRTYGGSMMDEGYGIDIDDETGLIIIGGRSFSADGYLSGNQGGGDGWVMQLHPNGDTIWNRTYGGTNNDDIEVIRYANNGLISAFGTTWSSGTGDIPVFDGQVGAWLMVTDATGNLSVSRVYSGILSDEGVDLAVLSDGYGLLVKSLSPELEGAMGHGHFDFWVSRVSTIGTVQWAKFFGGTDADLPARIFRVGGGFILVGATASSDGDVTENAGGYDFWVLRTNINGEILWQKTYGGSGDDIAYDAEMLPDGSIVILGESNSTDGDRSEAFGDKDVWLVRIDGNGTLLWERSYGGTNFDSGRRIVRTGNNHLAISAQSRSDNGHLSGNKGRQDLWLLYLNLFGDVIQQMNYGGTMDDFGEGIAATEDSIVYAVGRSLSDNGNLPFPGFEEMDLWLLRSSVDTVPCADNYECFTGNSVNFAVLEPDTDGPVVCVNGCSSGADPGPNGPPGCTDFDGAAAWFKVKTDGNAEAMSIVVTSTEFNIPQILVLQGTNCQNFTPINCDFGQDGSTNIINMSVEPDTSYYIVVGDAEGLEGAFDLCISVLNIEFCNTNPSLYVNNTSLGSPFEGPFKPGEDVQICYEVTMWDKLECNGLQGIVPEFGSGWDSLSFNGLGRPVQIDTMIQPVMPNGEWDWWQLGNVHYNFTNPVLGYSGGQTLPTGWYFVNYDDPEPNGNPDESIGDLIDCKPDDAMWKVCFTIRTQEDCDDNADCSVKIKSFADGEIGAIVNQACQFDPPLKINRSMRCCENPTMSPIPDITICSGDTLIITLESTLEPPVVYTWGINVSGNVIGATPGVSNNLIIQTLRNTGNTEGTVTYTVQGHVGDCETSFEQFVVTVRPQPSGNMTRPGPAVVCRDEPFPIRFDFIGNGPFIAEYAINGIVQPPILSETQSTTIFETLSASALITFVGFVDRNCPGDPNGAFMVTVLQPGEVTIDASICQGDSFQVGDHMVGFQGMYMFVLEGASNNGCDSLVTLNLEVNRKYSRSIEASICEGDVYVVGTNAYSESGIYTDTLESVAGCDSVINLLLTVTNEIIDEHNAVICAGDSYPFRGGFVFEDGTYYDTVSLSPTCDSIYILNLNVLDVITLIQTIIEPDTGQASGTIAIQIAGGIPPYSYLWSNGDTTNQQSGLAGGNYSLTVTDLIGCSAEFNFFIVSGTEDLLPGFNSVTVYPNPVQDGGAVHILFERAQGASQELRSRIFSAAGGLCAEEQISLTGAKSIYTVEKRDLNPGLHFIQFTDMSSGVSIVRSVVIQ